MLCKSSSRGPEMTSLWVYLIRLTPPPPNHFFAVSSRHVNVTRSCHTWSIEIASLLCGSSHVSSNYLVVRNSCHILSNQMASLLYGFSYVSPNSLFVRSSLNTLWHRNGFSPVWVFSCLLKALGSERLLSHFEH